MLGYIIYDGVDSRNLGLIRITNSKRGTDNFTFGYNRSVISDKAAKIDNPYYYGYDSKCLEFKITFANEDGQPFNEYRRRELVRWLYKKDYRPLVFGENTDVVYYCMPVDCSRLDNGLNEGYITVKFVCNSPFAYSKTRVQTYTKGVDEDIMRIENLCNVKDFYYPEIEIQMLSSGNAIIKNLNTDEESIFKNLNSGETVYIHNELKQIISSDGLYRLRDFNRKWTRLIQGVNHLKFIGDMNVSVRTSFPISL